MRDGVDIRNKASSEIDSHSFAGVMWLDDSTHCTVLNPVYIPTPCLVDLKGRDQFCGAVGDFSQGCLLLKLKIV